jgi:hypothetical protein
VFVEVVFLDVARCILRSNGNQELQGLRLRIFISTERSNEHLQNLFASFLWDAAIIQHSNTT